MQHPDSYFMEQAIRLSAKGRPLSPPNPAVGCVIVRDGEIIASGFTQKAGGHHAEIEALTDAERRGVNIEGATVYVTLEPCSHYGRTPALRAGAYQPPCGTRCRRHEGSESARRRKGACHARSGWNPDRPAACLRKRPGKAIGGSSPG